MMLADLFTLSQSRLDKIFSHYLKESYSDAPILQEAMAYSVFNGGKRIRPILVYAANLIFDAPLENCDVGACAIEFMHTYSLIHDDLPAMDNADLRRGKPSCHKKYGDALAILAGDSLLPLAFEVIGSHPAPLSTDQRLKMINLLTRASGYNGMAAGQTLDISGVHTPEALVHMYQLKTGALLNASLQLGAIGANVQDSNAIQALAKYADAIGLAFQIQDDLLDFEGHELTGKPQGIDVANQKTTYPAQLGIEKTRLKIRDLFSAAIEAVELFGQKGEILREIANYLMQRKT